MKCEIEAMIEISNFMLCVDKKKKKRGGFKCDFEKYVNYEKETHVHVQLMGSLV